ncbi:hypothetical protein [Cerasicoccus fimbriatus]|uniref:hypothetical protein n=1 Tax=Cerasicoccus fimbriatus TaxID=3014554 RepID=UPI0022B463A8|nr:hypothetical protein [Cerasicoccus sp. TK19100]
MEIPLKFEGQMDDNTPMQDSRNSSEKITPYIIQGIALAILVAILLALMPS